MSFSTISAFSSTNVTLKKKNIILPSPSPPISFSIVSKRATSITLQWTPGNDNGYAITKHSIQRSSDNISWRVIYETPASYCTITGLLQNTLYYFRISSTNINGMSNYTSSLSETTSTGTSISGVKLFDYDLEDSSPINFGTISGANLSISVPETARSNYGRVNFDSLINNKDVSMNGVYPGYCIRSDGDYAYTSAISGRNGMFYYYGTSPFNSGSNVSVSFWFYPEPKPALIYRRTVLSLGDSTQSNGISTWFQCDASNNVNIGINDAQTNNSTLMKPLNKNAWNHIVYTFTRTTTSLTNICMYVNNSQLVTNLSLSYGTTISDTNNYAGIYIGGNTNPAWGTAPGYVNNVKVFQNKTLNSTEVDILYNLNDI